MALYMYIYNVHLGHLVSWMEEQTEGLGVELYLPGYPTVGVLFRTLNIVRTHILFKCY